MRVLHVTHQYPPAIGGSERYIADLSEELAVRGHQVDVFTSRAVDFHTWRNVLPGSEQRNGVNVFRFRSLQRRAYVWSILNFGLRHYWPNRSRRYEPLIFLGGGPLSPGMCAALLRRSRQYDLIHLNCLVYAQVAYGFWAARRAKVPVVITPHAHVEQLATYDVGYQRAALAGCDQILADTVAEQEFLTCLNLPPERISLGGIGLRPELYPLGDKDTIRAQFGLPADQPVALFLGRKDLYKGPEIALQAYIQLQARYPNLHLLAVGPETAESHAMWPRYGEVRNLHLRGAVTDEEKLQALQACDFLVLPSVGEAFGIVFLEAWIMGKPVIGARTQIVQTVINEHRDGLLAEPFDPIDLARQMAYLVEHPDRARAMGQRGREKVLSLYTVAHLTDRIEAIYRQVIDSRHSTAARVVTVPQLPDPLPSVAWPVVDLSAKPDTGGKSAMSTIDVTVVEIRDPEMDQKEIQQRLKTQVQQRLEADGYGPPVEMLGPSSLRPQPIPAASNISVPPHLDRLLSEIVASSELAEYPFRSSVPLIGCLIVALRRFWNWMSTKWYVRPILAQQSRYNQKAALTLNELAQWQELHDHRLSELQQRVTELEHQLAEREPKK